MPGVIDVAFGPYESFVVAPKGDDFPPFWSGFVCDGFEEALNSTKKIWCFAGTGSNTWFVALKDGGWKARLHKDFVALLKQVRLVQWMSIGPAASYMFKDGEGELYWWNIPTSLQKVVQKSKAQLIWATLGQHSSYVACFDDGTFIWEVVEEYKNYFSG